MAVREDTAVLTIERRTAEPSADAVVGVPDAAPAALEDGALEEAALVAALRARDEAAFETLVDRYHTTLLRVARLHVADADTAEEVVQETWLGVLKGIDRFEGRSSLKTWLFRILINRAKTRGVREQRAVAFSALAEADADGSEPAVDADRFWPGGHQWAGHWCSAPQAWDDVPEAALLSRETRAAIESAIAALPPNQQAIIRLRDVDGCTAEEVCAALGITDGNQRVLLHRARSRVRAALEAHLRAN